MPISPKILPKWARKGCCKLHFKQCSLTNLLIINDQWIGMIFNCVCPRRTTHVLFPFTLNSVNMSVIFWVAFPVASILNQIFWSNSVCAIYSVCDMQRVNNGTKCSKHDVCNCLLERAKSILHSESLLFTRTYVYVCVVRVLYMLNTTYVRVLINLNYWKGHPYNKGRPHKGEGVYQKRRGLKAKSSN